MKKSLIFIKHSKNKLEILKHYSKVNETLRLDCIDQIINQTKNILLFSQSFLTFMEKIIVLLHNETIIEVLK